MSASFNRYVIGGLTVRFYAERRDTINSANLLTRATERQHRAVHVKDHGWLVKDATQDGVYYDVDGKLPKAAADALPTKDW